MVALRDPDADVRASAIGALVTIDPPPPLPPLIAAVQGPDASERQAAVEVLKRMVHWHSEFAPTLAPVFATALRDHDPKTYKFAAAGLSECGSSASTPVTADLTDKNPEVRVRVLAAIFGSDVQTGVTELISEPRIQAALIDALNRQDAEVIARAGIRRCHPSSRWRDTGRH